MFDFTGAWTVIQRRFNGKENFNRTWDEYRDGFGERRLSKVHEFMFNLKTLFLGNTKTIRILDWP